ncbi:MAG: signal recognition particle-docking protein FtsY [Clostridia bacterium]|nr:signal recognition particle-docking protein FtsY [Clostridia bacterium]
MGLFSKIKSGLQKTRDQFSNAVNSVVSAFTRIDDELFEELEEILVLADTGVPTAQRICEKLKKRVKDERVTDPALIKQMLKEEIATTLDVDNSLKISTKPSLILVIGVNGVGKTTSIGKIAARLKSEGKSVILGAADTFRAAASEQLQIWADRVGVPIVKHGEGSDPAAVVFDTIASAKSRGSDVIICDTAGRLHNKKNLMDELAKISRIIARELPDSDVEVLLVLDATTGQNAVNQAREFKNAADITGIVLTKLDGTARGGVVLAINDELNIPVKLIGVGEQMDDLQDFSAQDFADAMFD